MSPENRAHIQPSSIDVTLGDNIYRIANTGWRIVDLARDEIEFAHETIGDEGLRLRSGECVLAHTHEFIGSTGNLVPMLKDRSTLGRNFLTTHTGAGWGDAGYHNRWTLEIRNMSPNDVILPRRARVAQMAFFEGTPVAGEGLYWHTGSYQSGPKHEKTFEELESAWSPMSMLPKNKW